MTDTEIKEVLLEKAKVFNNLYKEYNIPEIIDPFTDNRYKPFIDRLLPIFRQLDNLKFYFYSGEYNNSLPDVKFIYEGQKTYNCDVLYDPDDESDPDKMLVWIFEDMKEKVAKITEYRLIDTEKILSHLGIESTLESKE